MKDRKGIGGRPRDGAKVKKSPLNLRTDPDLRAEIEASAKAHGLTLTKAAERLIRRGLVSDAAADAFERGAAIMADETAAHR